MRLTDFKVLTFDCYGTLIDWESGIWQAMQPLVAKLPAPPSREAALVDFARHESEQESETPDMRYSALLAHVHRRLAQAWGVPADPAAGAAFGDSVKDWPAFPDSPAALQYLARHYALVILSNVDRASFAHSERLLGVEFTAIHTAEDIGSYKPDPRNFRYLIEELERAGHKKGEILHTAQSLFHDHGPANRCGLASAWIDRGRGTEGGGATMRPDPGVRYDFRFPDMAAMAAAHRAETAQR